MIAAYSKVCKSVHSFIADFSNHWDWWCKVIKSDNKLVLNLSYFMVRTVTCVIQSLFVTCYLHKESKKLIPASLLYSKIIIQCRKLKLQGL